MLKSYWQFQWHLDCVSDLLRGLEGDRGRDLDLRVALIPPQIYWKLCRNPVDILVRAL
jgi:hypothetical protein